MGEDNYTVAEVLRICRTEGMVVCTKTDSNALRSAINEAMGRGYLVRSQPGVYRLTPSGYGFLDELERLERSQAVSNVARNNKIDKIKIRIGFIKSKPFIEASIIEVISIVLTFIGVLVAILQVTVGLF